MSASNLDTEPVGVNGDGEGELGGRVADRIGSKLSHYDQHIAETVADGQLGQRGGDGVAGSGS